MFKNKKAKIDLNMTDTLIGEGTSFEGKIKSEAGIRVEGQMVGDIECAGDITVGENGIARSHIKARNVVVAGQVVGDVAASGKLTIKSTGQLRGNLSALELSIESGGIFQGSSRMDFKDSPVELEEKPQVKEPEISIPIVSEGDAVSVLKTW
ncbi:bactofilin family protein [Cohnella lupini]|uniref:Cytoskeletal protein CcmA (Bactofilin family) n=1 Tax=Cohnella lupini TaxID=1294267 RepID=A0A3D9I4Z0_9BACL|nr:polymer-forming cytoskeletal protein [Cohnella lupini]RED56824.1 cytoskeletal protein CcmA (bactofilin family) [Cohnella lupini]